MERIYGVVVELQRAGGGQEEPAEKQQLRGHGRPTRSTTTMMGKELRAAAVTARTGQRSVMWTNAAWEHSKCSCENANRMGLRRLYGMIDRAKVSVTTTSSLAVSQRSCIIEITLRAFLLALCVQPSRNPPPAAPVHKNVQVHNTLILDSVESGLDIELQ